MSIFNIPVQSRTDANSLSVELSDVVFQLNFRFNLNESKWYMDIVQDNEHIVSGIKLVESDDLLSQYRAYDVPSGKILIVDKDGLFKDPNETNFGESVFLRYDDNVQS